MFWVVLGLVVYDAVVLSTIWNWLIASQFDVARLTMLQAASISLMIGYFFRSLAQMSAKLDALSKKPASELLNEAVAYALITPLVYLLLAWILTLFL